MRECSDPNVDLEDLIFDEDAGGPSERQEKPGENTRFFYFSLYRTGYLGYNKSKCQI